MDLKSLPKDLLIAAITSQLESLSDLDGTPPKVILRRLTKSDDGLALYSQSALSGLFRRTTQELYNRLPNL